MKLRTDLAVETKEIYRLSEEDGFIEEITEGDIPVTTVRITKQKAAELTGKPMGRYTTIYFDGAFSDDDLFDRAIDVAAEVLRTYFGDVSSVLAVGLGNEHMTSDALGPNIVSRLIVSRHLKEGLPDLYSELALGELSVLRPGVLGQTGIESAELIRAAVKQTKPDCLLIFDALASRKADRLCATIQISDTGITPGSGVGNHRDPINRETVGVPVICVGIPTVVDAATLTVDALNQAKDTLGEEAAHLAELWEADDGRELRRAMGGYENNLVVTPQDIDVLIKKAAKLLSQAANKAIHGNLSREEIDMLSEI